MIERLPQNEAPEPDEPEIQPEPPMPRFIVRLGWIAFLFALAALLMTDFGRPETLPDGTVQSTWTGRTLFFMLVGGFVIIFFSASPWGLLQVLVVAGGAILGGLGLAKLLPETASAGRFGVLFGMLLGAGVAFALTWLTSRLVDTLRSAHRPRADLQRRIDRHDKPGHDNG